MGLVYKVLDRDTGLFKRRGGAWPRWSEHGDTYSTPGTATAAMKQAKKRVDTQNLEVVAYRTVADDFPAFEHVHVFTELCRFIVRMRGQEDESELLRARVGCHLSYDCDGGLFYRDEHVLIGAATDSLALFVERLSNNNPVLCIREDGKRIRYHGEAIHLHNHVRELLFDPKGYCGTPTIFGST